MFFRSLSTTILIQSMLLLVPAFGDLIKLKNGGEVRGSILVEKKKSSSEIRSIVRMKTVRGTTVEIDRKDIEFISRRRFVEEVYETREPKTPKDVDSQWNLAEWCRSKNLLKQRKIHLRNILDVDPDHIKARRSLGYQKYRGDWMTRDEISLSQGLVKFKGKYITPEEAEILAKSDQIREREKDWFKKVRIWSNWLSHKSPKKVQQGQSLLLEIEDPAAIVGLKKFLGDHRDSRLRSFYIDIVAGIDGPEPVEPLVRISLYDNKTSVRQHALTLIEKTKSQAAMPFYARELKSKNNLIVRRAASALSNIGDDTVVPNLIEALTSKHIYKVRVRDNRTHSFGSDGSYLNGAMLNQLPPSLVSGLRSGQYPYGVTINHAQPQLTQPTRVVRVRVEHKNREVLSALKKITSQGFEYDKRTWRLWFEAYKLGAVSKKPKKNR